MPDRIEQAKRLRFSLYMHNRTKAYDFTKSKEIRECFKMSVCALIDYCINHREARLLEESFDASIELHDPVTWMSVGGDNTQGDSLVKKTMKSITETADLFYKLIAREENVSKALLTKILHMESEIRVYVLGETFEEPVYNIEEFVNQVFSNIEIPKNTVDSEEAYMSFIDYISEL